MMEWNDLRLVLAIRRGGSLTAAATILQLNHSTIFRRLRNIETSLGDQLFERALTGSYLPTQIGARIATAAERIEEEVLALDRERTGHDHALTGNLRITCSETLASTHLMRHLVAFQAGYAGIALELIIDSRMLSLSRREADIALRPVRPLETYLWGRKLASVAWCLYASPEYLSIKQTDVDTQLTLGDHAVVGWEDGVTGIAAAEWIAKAWPATQLKYRSNSLLNQALAASAGMGIALLPCYLGDHHSGLARAVPDPVSNLEGELWLVTHVDLRSTARVRAFFDAVGQGLASDRALFEGR